MTMRAVCISDTHGQHRSLKMPKGDLLIHAGDVTSRGSLQEVQEFLGWFSRQSHPYKLFIAGNHDFYFEQATAQKIAHLIPPNVIYLNDSGVEIAGINFWGSPVTPWFYDWAFNRDRGPDMKRHWDLIPQNIDVLVTHGPPFGILDATIHGRKVGCEELRMRLDTIRPRVHVFGHIHEAAGKCQHQGTTFVNASVLDQRYQLLHPPVVLDL